MNLFDIFGLLGVIICMTSYTVVKTGYVKGDSLAYILTTMLSAILVLISLAESFNLAAALIQVFWIVTSVIGILRLFLGKMTAYNHAKNRSSSRRRRSY